MCYVYGCDADPVVNLTYRDTMAQTQTEARCEDCAFKLKANDRNDILAEEVLDDSYTSDTDNSTSQQSLMQRGWLC